MPKFALVAGGLVMSLVAASAVAQSVEEDDVEVLTGAGQPVTQSQVDIDQAERLITERTNAFRKDHDLPPLSEDQHLTAAAQYFADYMARTDRYGHHADGKRPAQRAKDHEYDYCVVLENIAYQYSSAGFETERLAARFVEGWKESPEHRKNMLDPDVRELAVAIARSDQTGHWYAVQLLGRPESAALEFHIANRSGADVTYTIGDRTYQLPDRYSRTHLRCRQATVRFNRADGGVEDLRPITPETGDHFVIERGGEGLRITRKQDQAADASAAPPTSR